MEKLQQKIIIQGKIKALTGMHIGGTNQQMGIGGPDNLVIRNPISQKPIIPGSSLKGKMRALLELSMGKYGKDGAVGNAPEITKLFGKSGGDNDSHASRLLVRDAEMCVEDDEAWNDTDMLFTEAKTEVVINRLTSKATPRTFERVPAGATFQFEMVVNVVCEDNEVDKKSKELCELLAQGMELVQDDALGGHGSRGYGQIKFSVVSITTKGWKVDKWDKKDTNENVKNLFVKFKK